MISLEVKEKFIEAARKRHHKIYPLERGMSLMESFTTVDNEPVFWYNDSEDSTHIIQMKDIYHETHR